MIQHQTPLHYPGSPKQSKTKLRAAKLNLHVGYMLLAASVFQEQVIVR
jgi:hypothetical protein